MQLSSIVCAPCAALARPIVTSSYASRGTATPHDHLSGEEQK